MSDTITFEHAGFITLPQNHPTAVSLRYKGRPVPDYTCGTYDDIVVGTLDVTRVAEHLAKEVPK